MLRKHIGREMITTVVVGYYTRSIRLAFLIFANCTPRSNVVTEAGIMQECLKKY